MNLSSLKSFRKADRKAGSYDNSLVEKLHTYTSCLMIIKPKFCFSKIGFKTLSEKPYRYPLTIQKLNNKKFKVIAK